MLASMIAIYNSAQPPGMSKGPKKIKVHLSRFIKFGSMIISCIYSIYRLHQSNILQGGAPLDNI